MFSLLSGNRSEWGPEWPFGMGPPMTWGDYFAVLAAVLCGASVVLGIFVALAAFIVGQGWVYL